MPESAGMTEKKVLKASSPPADAPIPTTKLMFAPSLRRGAVSPRERESAVPSPRRFALRPSRYRSLDHHVLHHMVADS